MRGREGFEDLGSDKAFVNLVETLDETLVKSPKFETKTFRSLSFDDRRKFDDFIKNIKSGRIFSEKGFLSTSTDDLSRFMDGKYRMKIEVNGKNGVLVKDASINTDENEVLFRKGTSFKIDDLDKIYDDRINDNAEYIMKLSEL